MKRVGVLALQGDFEAHGKTLEAIGAEPVFVRQAADLESIAGLILPGGESTTMLKLLHREGLFGALREFAAERPLFGTCAGLILMAEHVTHPEQESLRVMDVTVERNGYGRQVDSRVQRIAPTEEFEKTAGPGDIEAVFIRAPIIRSVGAGVRVLAEYGGTPVLVAQGKHLAATFHPELTGEGRIHQVFLKDL